MKEKAFKACLRVIEREGWKSFTFSKASEESGIPLNIFYKYFSAPTDVIAYVFQKIDEEVLKKRDPSLNTLSPKDILFDLLMTRFDASLDYKPTLQRFWQDCLLIPTEAPALTCQGFSSMAWMLEAAGLNPRGLTGFLRVQGLMALYLLTLRIWLTDNSSDLGKTMSFLDKGLSRMEKAAALLGAF